MPTDRYRGRRGRNSPRELIEVVDPAHVRRTTAPAPPVTNIHYVSRGPQFEVRLRESMLARGWLIERPPTAKDEGTESLLVRSTTDMDTRVRMCLIAG